MNLRVRIVMVLTILMFTSNQQIKTSGSTENLEKNTFLIFWPFLAIAGATGIALSLKDLEKETSRTIILIKAKEKNVEAIENLIQKGWSINEISGDETVLNVLIKNHDVDSIVTILKKFPDIIIRPEDMQEALDRSQQGNGQSRKNALEILELLANNKKKKEDEAGFRIEEYKRDNGTGLRLARPKSKL